LALSSFQDTPPPVASQSALTLPSTSAEPPCTEPPCATPSHDASTPTDRGDGEDDEECASVGGEEECASVGGDGEATVPPSVDDSEDRPLDDSV